MWVALCLVALLVVAAQTNDSLKSALNAVHRRQRDLASYYSRPYALGAGQPEDIGYGYQKTAAPSTLGVFDSSAVPSSELGTHDAVDINGLEKLIYDYLEGEARYPGKRSVFRENSNYPEGLQALYDDKEEGSSFRERLGKSRLRNAHALLRSYAGPQPERYPAEEDALDVLNSVWEKYRGEDPEAADEADVKNIFEYLYPEERKRYGGYPDGYDFFNSPLAWAKRDDVEFLRDDDRARPTLGEEGAFDERYRPLEKRYPVAKRSPGRRKKSADRRTDPKVARELSAILAENSTRRTEATAAPNATRKADRPLDIKKKSVDWSEYFGVDRRRKKSGRADDGWLVERYLEAYGRGKPKREDMDAKLRAMEDLIVDQAVKYTGSHEGATDAREIRLVKEKVMAQLAAAYSLEKMRRALAEFRSSIAAQQAAAPPSHSLPPPPELTNKEGNKEKKKLEGSQDKPEKKDASREMSNRINTQDIDREEECPVLDDIEERCSVAGGIALDKDSMFLPLCMLHQICYLCGGESGGATPRGCDATLLSETASVCRGDAACRLTGRRTLDALRGFRSEASPLGCDLHAQPCLARFLSARR